MKFGIILSGCGYLDGAEIYETVMTMYFLEKHGFQYRCFAPEDEQFETMDHVNQKPATTEKRSVFTEAARLTRSDILSLTQMNMDDLDGIIFPGGFGVVKTFCTFAVEGPDMQINAEIKELILAAHFKKKIIAGMCISPVLIAFALKDQAHQNMKMTVGQDVGIQQVLNGFNASAVGADASELVVDKENKIITTPAYMDGKSILEISKGIEALVLKLPDLV